MTSPNPTLRATSTSRFGSIVNEARPSTSAGRDPRVVERRGDRLARERQLGVDESLAERGLPDPDDRDLVAEHRTLRRAPPSPPFELARAALDEARDALGGVHGRRDELHVEGLLLEGRRAVDVERAVEQLLREPDRLRRALREPRRPLGRGRGRARPPGRRGSPSRSARRRPRARSSPKNTSSFARRRPTRRGRR